jgi:hypothetical protein
MIRKSATHPKPTWTSPVFKAKETEQNFEAQKLKANVLGEIQVVSAVRFVKQTTHRVRERKTGPHALKHAGRKQKPEYAQQYV